MIINSRLYTIFCRYDFIKQNVIDSFFDIVLTYVKLGTVPNFT